jgi:aminopeptidase YwaD
MFPWFDSLSIHIQPERMLNDIRRISRIHRFAFTPGLKEVAAMIQAELAVEGVQSWIERYPADRTSRFWAYPSKPEWRVEKAVLELVLPDGEKRLLADYSAVPLSVVQYSYPFSGVLELVYVDETELITPGCTPDVKNRLVLTNGRLETARKVLVDEGGAAGLIVYDIPPIPPVRARRGLADECYQAVFNWTNEPDEKTCFGFVLSPRQGERLKTEIQLYEEHRWPGLKAVVDLRATMADDQFPVVVGLIPGQTAKEIVVVSHFCHPAPSANDNASGNAAALEIARAVIRMIREGRIGTPKRSIRFLWVPEMSGSYAYLSNHEDQIGNMVCGLNLDMVGGDQCKNGSSLLIEFPPDASPSFTGYLLERMRRELFNDTPTHTGMDPYPLFRWASTGFAGASDHLVFNDPTVGVPMPMLHQYPDRFHHNTGDLVENLDPAMIRRSAIIGAGYVTFLALAGSSDLFWLAGEMQTQFMDKLARRQQMLVDRLYSGAGGCLTPSEYDSTIDHLYRVFQKSMQSLQNLSEGTPAAPGLQAAGMEALLEHYKSRYRELYPPENKPSAVISEWEKMAGEWVPVRRVRGPTPFFRVVSDWPEVDRKLWSDWITARPVGGNTLPVLVEFWADGNRTALEIARCIRWETGVWAPEIVVHILETLKKFRLVELKVSSDR